MCLKVPAFLSIRPAPLLEAKRVLLWFLASASAGWCHDRTPLAAEPADALKARMPSKQVGLTAAALPQPAPTTTPTVPMHHPLQFSLLRFSLLSLCALLFLWLAVPVDSARAQAFVEDFSDDSQFTVEQGALGSDGDDNYFLVDNGTSINKSYDGVTGSFLAAQDTDDPDIAGGAAPVQVEWTGIDISTLSDPIFTGLFGSVLDDNGDIDDSDFIRVEYKVDGGTYQDLIAFENDGTSSNTTFQEDTDFDGVGEGTDISSGAGAMESFQKPLPSGSTLDLRLTAHVNSGDEDFAVDDFLVKEAGSPQVQFTSNGTTVSEDAGTATLTVELLGSPSPTASADVVFSSSASSASTDDIGSYSTQTVSLSSDGDTEDVTVTITDDNAFEGTETAEFVLQNASGAEVGGGPFTLTITGDDSPLVINEVLADPPSDASGDANGDGTRDGSEDEFVEIYNDGGSDVDVSGFTVEDGNSTRHTFPEGTVISSGEAVTIFGGGSPAVSIPGIVQTASSGGFGLNNGGDDVVVKNASGGEVNSITYGSEGGDNQSLTRDPDFTGSFVKHSNASGSGGALFSPGETVEGNPLPVEMATFEGQATQDGIALTWRTVSETNNAGFEVQRHSEAGSWKEVKFIEGAGTTSEPQTYRFTDSKVPFSAQSVTYRLRQVDLDGSASFSKKISVARGATDELQLRKPFPNPSSGPVTIHYAIPEVKAQGARLEIFDALGRQVKSMAPPVQKGGERATLQLNAGSLASGTYFIRLTAEQKTLTRRMTVVR